MDRAENRPNDEVVLLDTDARKHTIGSRIVASANLYKDGVGEDSVAENVLTMVRAISDPNKRVGAIDATMGALELERTRITGAS